jgi:hypothetical protein
MFNTTGFDFDVLISRLYGGICAFQSLRAHRRQRAQGEAPPPESTQAPEAAAATPQPQPARAPDVTGEAPPPTLEPQGFITIGGRVLPLFGDVGAFTFDASPPAPPSASSNPPPGMSPVPPPPVAPPASGLILPPPTPPASLRHLYAAAQEPAPTGEPVEAARPAGALPTVQVEQAPSGPSINTLLAARARDEAARLEQLQTEHRAHLALLLREHRAELDARAQAEAARTTQLLRELLAEHRAELERATTAHAAEIASVLAQYHEVLAERRAVGLEHDQHGDAMRQALTEQATLQREAHEEVAHHISTLTTVVADIGQTVTMLAMATFEGQQSRLPTTAPTVAPPPQPEGADAPSSPPLAAPAPAERAAIVVPMPEPAAAVLPGALVSASITDSAPPHPIASDAGGSVILDLRKPAGLRAVAHAQDRALALDDD